MGTFIGFPQIIGAADRNQAYVVGYARTRLMRPTALVAGIEGRLHKSLMVVLCLSAIWRCVWGSTEATAGICAGYGGGAGMAGRDLQPAGPGGDRDAAGIGIPMNSARTAVPDKNWRGPVVYEFDGAGFRRAEEILRTFCFRDGSKPRIADPRNFPGSFILESRFGGTVVRAR